MSDINVKTKITISWDESRGLYIADNKDTPGIPYIGQGATILEALGSYAALNREELGITLMAGKGLVVDL